MGISDVIAQFINELLEEDSTAEVQRSELASRFNCVPSQINYVISTRFSPERGYVVESRRGGNGYIRIRRVQSDPKLIIMHTVNAVGSRVDPATAGAMLSNCVSAGVLEESAARIMLSALSDQALRPVSPEGRDIVRASILKQMLLSSL